MMDGGFGWELALICWQQWRELPE